MNRGSILSILAGAGVLIYGTLTPDAVAFARALQSENPSALLTFADQHRDSPLAPKAIRLAKDQKGIWCPPDRRMPDGTCEGRGSDLAPKNSGYQT